VAGTARQECARSHPRHKFLQCNVCKRMGHIKKFCPQLMSESGHEHSRQGKSDEQFAGVSETTEVLVATVEQEEPVEALHVVNDADITRLWVLDSGATAHITRDLGMLDDVRPAPAGTYVRFGNGRKAKVTVMGAVNIHIKVMGRVEWLQLSDVLYCAEVTHNLPSTLCLTSKGAEVSVFKDGGPVAAHIVCDGKILAQLRKAGRLLMLHEADMQWSKGDQAKQCEVMESTLLPSPHTELTAVSQETELWHERLCHSPVQVLKILQKKGLIPERISLSVLEQCEPCVAGKQIRTVRHERTGRAERPMFRWHADLMGPMPIQGFDGSRYLLCILDDFSRFSGHVVCQVLDSVGLTRSLQAVCMYAPCCVLSDGPIVVGIGQVSGEWSNQAWLGPGSWFSCGHHPFYDCADNALTKAAEFAQKCGAHGWLGWHIRAGPWMASNFPNVRLCNITTDSLGGRRARDFLDICDVEPSNLLLGAAWMFGFVIVRGSSCIMRWVTLQGKTGTGLVTVVLSVNL
jgi:hypothetical protein